jgi:hypothetical protein
MPCATIEQKRNKNQPLSGVRRSSPLTIFPQMTNFWLREAEGAQLRFEFETELARLEAA